MVVIVVDEKQNNDLKFIEFGIPNADGNRSWGPGVRDYYMIHFILSGEGYFNGQLVKKGNYFISRPYQKIHYYSKVDNEWDYLWILLKGDEVKNVLSSYGLYSESGVGEFKGVEEIKQLSKTFFTKEYSMISGETALNWAKLVFSFNDTSKKEKNVNVKQKHLVKATEFIETKYFEGISPKNVAEFVGLDEKYLYSIFKSFLQTSVQEYINCLRIEKAKILLEKSDLNISEVSYSVGIDDPLNFSRFFKKLVGVSPRKYRDALKRDITQI